jgi:hypothetical protein
MIVYVSHGVNGSDGSTYDASLWLVCSVMCSGVPHPHNITVCIHMGYWIERCLAQGL